MRQKKQSNKTFRGLVLELRPDDNQKVLLSKHLNDCRFIYNQYVEEYLKALKEERIPNYKDYKELCTEYEFLKDPKHLNYNQGSDCKSKLLTFGSIAVHNQNRRRLA